MKTAIAVLSLAAACSAASAVAQDNIGQGPIKRVLLVSIDGMHAADFENCAKGISTVNNGDPYCPALAALSKTGVNYVAASTSKPSDSFPGLTAIVTGGSPALTGVYYDVAYSRNYDAPATTTGNGVAAGPCTPYAAPTGTTTEYEEGIDIDKTKLNGGAPGRIVDRWRPELDRSQETSPRPQQRLQSCLSLDLCSRQQHLQRDPQGGRLRRVV